MENGPQTNQVTSVQTQVPAPVQKSSKKKYVIICGGAILLLLFFAWFLFKFLRVQDIKKMSHTPKVGIVSTPTSYPFANWKTYQDSVTGLTFQYPSTWTVTEGPKHPSEQYFDYEYLNAHGPEGELVITNANQLGGGCSNDYTKLSLKDATVDVCNYTDKGKEVWAFYYGKANGGALMMVASTAGTSSSDEQTILHLMSTLHVSDSASSDLNSVVNAYALEHDFENPETTIETNDGIYAKGNIRDLNKVGGEKWFAFKQDGSWIVVHMGNGLPQCADVDQYHLPKSFLNCY